VLYRKSINAKISTMVQTHYTSKKALETDLRLNGYKVIATFTDIEINQIKNKSISDLPLSLSENIISWVKENL